MYLPPGRGKEIFEAYISWQSKTINRRDLSFILYELLNVESLISRARYADHWRDTFEAALDTAQQIAEAHFAPHNRKADLNEPTFDGERVHMIPEVGAALKLLAAKMLNTAKEATWAGADGLRKWGEQLEGAVQAAGDTIARLLGKTASGEADIALANSSVYLDMMGHVVIAWMWLQRALVAHVRSSGAGEEDRHFYRGKLQACQYFFNWELPKIRAQKRLLDSLDRTCLDMRDEWF